MNQQQDIINQIELNLWETWELFGRGPDCALHEEKETTWFETPIPLIPYNGVIRFQCNSNAKDKIDLIANHYRQRNVPFYWIWHPTSQPENLKRLLVDAGLSEVEILTGMARSLQDLPELGELPDNLTLRRVNSSDDVEAFHQFAVWRWGIPEEYKTIYSGIVNTFNFENPDSRFNVWQIWERNQPIAKVGLSLGKDSAGIYAVATRPEARRKGLARYLTLYALHEARSRGYTRVILHASPMAVSLYKDMGFKIYTELSIFASTDFHV